MTELTGSHRGTMQIKTKDENGMILSEDYGFTVQQENESVLAFDLLDHPDLGITLLFGNQVFALKFWDDEDLDKGLKIIMHAVTQEYQRRRDLDATV